MIELDLAYLKNSIRNSKHDYYEAGGLKSVNEKKYTGLGANSRKSFETDKSNESHMAFSSVALSPIFLTPFDLPVVRRS